MMYIFAGIKIDWFNIFNVFEVLEFGPSCPNLNFLSNSLAEFVALLIFVFGTDVLFDIERFLGKGGKRPHSFIEIHLFADHSAHQSDDVSALLSSLIELL